MKRTLLAISVLVISLSGCGKKNEADKGGGAGKPAAGGGGAPAAPAPYKLDKLGLQVEAPSGATIMDTSADAPNAKVSVDGCSVEVSTVTPAFASAFDAAKAEIQKDPNPFQKFTKEEQAAGGWHLEYELQSMIDKKPLYGVQVRTTVAGKQFECGTNAESAAERDCAAKVCASIKPM